jgi:3-oxoacyl-[acyl-carrier protein] reductase
MSDLANKTALVTGASRGIGRATAHALAVAGARVIVHYGNASKEAEALVAEIRRAGGRADAVGIDLGAPDGAHKLAAEVRKLVGSRLDILVANAGIWNEHDAPIEKMTEREWDEMVQVNLKSVYSVIHYSVPHMIAQKSGRIVAISSTAGQRGEAFHTHYGATKGAIISFVKGLASELGRYNIIVNCVAPGWVDTDMSASVLRTKNGLKSALVPIPLKRVGTAEEIAGPILFAASDLATFITGEVINVNGGSVLCG